ncbi:MAG: hypothetical protein D6728_16850 [Cyanobacteria bacterium J055]|nr:MAG: hypothetical protein D6728_16850 [Cyanobacteria bacterium J055]
MKRHQIIAIEGNDPPILFHCKAQNWVIGNALIGISPTKNPDRSTLFLLPSALDPSAFFCYTINAAIPVRDFDR